MVDHDLIKFLEDLVDKYIKSSVFGCGSKQMIIP